MIAELVSFYPGCQTTYRWQRALERNAWAPDWIIWGKPKSVFMFFFHVHHLPNFTIWRVLKIIQEKGSLSLNLPQYSLKLLRYLHGIPQGKDTVS